MKRLPEVVLTYGWCRVSHTILQSLAARGVRVHVVDSSPRAMCRYSRRCASFTCIADAYSEPNRFLENVLRVVNQTGAEIVIAGHEDALLLSRHRDRFPSNVLIPFEEAALIEQTLNKWSCMKLAEEAGVDIPATFKPDNWEELEEIAATCVFPSVIKTQRGNSGKTVYVVRSKEECLQVFENVVRTFDLSPIDWPIIQRFAEGEGYGVCVLYNKGEFRAGFCERYLRTKDGQFGTSVLRESVVCPRLIEQSRKLMDHIGWHGVAHLDFIYDAKTQQSALIEINPRFWGALDLAVRSGVDFPWLLYEMAVEGDVAPVTSYRAGVRSRWIVGEMIGLANSLAQRKLRRAASTCLDILLHRAAGHDDFRISDPVPLFAEMWDYGHRFLSTRSTNPVERGMVVPVQDTLQKDANQPQPASPVRP